MTAGKTKCRQCFYANAKVTQEPCSKCAEIQFVKKNFDNHFSEDIRNLMREE